VGAAAGGTPADLALAIEICSRPASSPSKSPRFDVRPSSRLTRRIFRYGMKRCADEFRAYLADYVALPKCWDSGKGRPVKSPVCLYSVAVLMRNGRLTESEAWATEFGYARHLTLALAEAGGNEINIRSAAEESALKEAGHNL
jgi:hypothetical protein